jgi:ABC-type Fe3+-citrate transport system substrate-binding protein
VSLKRLDEMLDNKEREYKKSLDLKDREIAELKDKLKQQET